MEKVTLTNIVINYSKRKLSTKNETAIRARRLSSIKLYFRYIEAEKQFLLINLKSKQMISVVQELNRHSRLEETIQGKTRIGEC